MKTYTVKEIADKLGTSEETVRRWIRTKKMDPVSKKTSNKAGFTVSEESLEVFLSKSPKYMGIVAAASTISPAAGIATAVISGGLAASIALGTKSKDSLLTKSELKMIVLSEIEKKNSSIKQKQQLIQQMDKEIQELRAEIIQYEAFLENSSKEDIK